MRGGERGEEAIQALSNRLAEVAAYHRRSETDLRAMLRRDRSLRLDPRGRLHYLCDGLVVPVVGGQTNLNDAPVAALFPLAQTFLLHSKPGSNRKIFLDFDGHTLSGNAWTATYNGGTNIIAPPWDTDGNPGSFSSDEQTAIQQIWFRVAEDFAPFDVDVTTEFPGESAMTRNSFGDSTYGTRALVSAISSYIGNYGGIAYVGAFDSIGDFNKPALVFPEKLGNNEKNIAEAISHEVGHNLGLSHDGISGGAEYYTGQGDWAPIMGVGYSKPIVQWSRGEYATPSNTEQDYTIIGQNGLSFRTDDFGNTTGTATALVGFASTNTGIIERTNDVDFFSFQTGGGAATFTVTPWERGANCHFLLALYNSGGTLLTNREVADTGNGVEPVGINAILGAGLHYLSIEGIGVGNPLTTGYPDYGSLGNYTLTVGLPPSSQWLPTVAGNFSWTNTANWLNGAVPNSTDTVASVNNNIAGNQTITLDAPLTIGRLVLGDTNATHGFTLANGNGGGLTFDVSSGVATISKAQGTNDLIATSLVLQDDLIVSNSAAARLTLGGAISGSGTFTKTGAGLVSLAGTNSYSGETIIATGTLAMDATAAFSGAAIFDVRSNAILNTTAFGSGWPVNSAQQFRGQGSVVGSVAFNAGSTLKPGAPTVAGTLTFSNQLALNGGMTWAIDLAATNTVGGGTNDLVVVGGNLVLTGTNTIQVNLLEGMLESPGVYTILTYGGALLGGASNLVATSISRQVFAVDVSVPGQIRLQVSVAPAALTWRGDGVLNRWDTDTLNWSNGGVSDKFYALDSVTFNDSGSNNTSINLLSPLMPAAVTVTGTKDYAWVGAGWITGGASVTKLGSGTLTVATANDFTGPVKVEAGVLKVGVMDALGSTAGATLVTNSGRLDINGSYLGAEPLIVSGAGAGNGAIINSGGPQFFALRFVTLAGDATFGGNERWDVRANSTGSLTGNNFKLTKTDTNEIWFADLGDTGLGDIAVEQGVLGIQGTTTLGNPTNALTLFPATTLRLSSTDANILSKHLRMTNASIAMSDGNNVFAGSMELDLTNTFEIESQFEINGAMSGNGVILKSGAGTLLLCGSNSFSGQLQVDTASATSNDGAVKITSNAALQNVAAPLLIRNADGGSSTLQLGGGVVVTQALSLAGRNVGVAALQNLDGTNTFAGDLWLQEGGTNYWVQSDAGVLQLGGVLPASTPVGAHAFTMLGAGDIIVSGVFTNGAAGGATSVIKSGAGLLKLLATNSYTGGTWLNEGVIQAESSGAFGSGAIIADSGTNIARIILANGVTITNSVAALAVNPGSGAGFLSCGDTSSATLSGPIQLNGPALSGGHFAGPTRGGISGPGEGEGGTNVLHVIGPITAPSSNAVIVRLGNVRFSGAGNYSELQVRAGTTSLGVTDGLATNAVLDLGGNGNPQAVTSFDLNGFNQTLAGLKNAVATNNPAWITNSATATNTLTLNLGVTTQSFGGSIVGPVAVTLNSGTQTFSKSGGSSLNGLYTFTGKTVINGGTLVLAAGITLANTPLIKLGGNGALDVSASGLTLSGTQTIQGDGGIIGNFTNAGVLLPGNTIGILTCSNELVLGATSQTRIEIRCAPTTNDLLRANGTLTYGGSLVVTNLVGTLAVGDSFKIFDATSYTGHFTSTNLPSLSAPLAWQFTPSNGTLSVMSTVATNPTNITAALVGNALQLSWPANHLGWRLEAQTNALTTGLNTNWFTVTGSTATNLVVLPLDVAPGSVFFRLVYP